MIIACCGLLIRGCRWPFLWCGVSVTRPGRLWYDDRVTRRQKYVLLHTFTLQHGGVIERQLEIPAVLVMKYVNVFSLGIISQSASLADCLEDGHAICKFERSFPFDRPGQINFFAVNLGHNDGHIRRANDTAKLLLNHTFYL